MQVRPGVLDVELPAIPPGEVQFAQIDGHLIVVFVKEDLHLLGQLDGSQVAAGHFGLVSRGGILVDGEHVDFNTRMPSFKHVPDLPVRSFILSQGHHIQRYLFACRGLGGGGRCLTRATGRHQTGRGQGADPQKIAPTNIFLSHFFLLTTIVKDLINTTTCTCLKLNPHHLLPQVVSPPV